jgi:hypothetical protein
MAISRDFILSGLRGRLGPLVVRQCNGRTIISHRPSKTKNPPTDVQFELRERFKRASRRVQELLADPERARAYAREAKEAGMPAFAIAMADVMHPPEATDVVKEWLDHPSPRVLIDVNKPTIAEISVTLELRSGLQLPPCPLSRLGRLSWTAEPSGVPETDPIVRATFHLRDFAGEEGSTIRSFTP